ncbi:serine hydrolase [Kutzneria sp. 744]|uniref:serine hydrolase n=1 Tax=Kutzneria sp. (strain 744) TaxID=345341 RepID=UPI0003EEB1CD|nr:serine hydrolase [Kutzneria sp. 744]EWM18308.1 beta-lactamase [Kutzneria sp. 744]
MPLPRRTLLLGGLAATLAGCSTAPTTTPPPSTTTSSAAQDPDLAALEQKFGGRLGFYALDTGSGRSVAHRADERFLMCSTHKVLVVGAILQLRQQQPGLLDRVIAYDKSKVLSYAPVTSLHTSMTEHTRVTSIKWQSSGPAEPPHWPNCQCEAGHFPTHRPLPMTQTPVQP